MLIVGTKEAHELTMTRAGANQHSHVLLRRSMGARKTAPPAPTPQTPPENTAMDATLMKALLGLDDKQKAYFLALPDDKTEAFLKKSAADRTAEVDAAQAEIDKAKALAEGKTAREVELERSVSTMKTELDTLKAKDAQRDADATIEKRVRDEFAGFPGDELEDPADKTKVIQRSGVERATAMLKSAAVLSPAARTDLENMMKAQCTMAKRAGSTIGLHVVESAKGANAKIDAEVNKRVTESKGELTRQKAYLAVAEDPAWSETFEQAELEQQQARRSA